MTQKLGVTFALVKNAVIILVSLLNACVIRYYYYVIVTPSSFSKSLLTTAVNLSKGQNDLETRLFIAC